MRNRNASASLFGWDFQVNVAIVLVLENIKNVESVRVEGKDEDIEITLENQRKIYAQAKSVVKPDDYTNVKAKLKSALETLNQAARNGDASLFTYATNSSNPFHIAETIPFFTGRTHLNFDELPDLAKAEIKRIVADQGYTDIDLSKFDIRVVPFYGDDPKNRYKVIQTYVNEFLGDMRIYLPKIEQNIIQVWQRDLFHNATTMDTAITVNKKELIWPLIVLLVDEVSAMDYKRDFDDDEVADIESKYRLVINQHTLSYDIVSRVLTDYSSIKPSIRTKEFVDQRWVDYLDIMQGVDTDDQTKESLIKIIIYRILSQRQCINDIKRGTNV